MKLVTKIFFLLLFSITLLSCNSLAKQYKNLTLYNNFQKQKRLIKPLLKTEKKPLILVISWRKHLLKKENLHYIALLYNPITHEKKIVGTSSETPSKILPTRKLYDTDYNSLIYILDNYQKGNEEYLLSLHDSFDSSEANYLYFIYDFQKNKRVKIASILLDDKGKVIQ